MALDPRSPHLQVSCYAGHRGEEVPRRFSVDGREVGVAEVLDRWQTPDQRTFRLRGDDGRVYALRHDSRGDRWELTAVGRRGER